MRPSRSVAARRIALAAALTLIALPAVAQTPDTRPGIAVFPFTNGGSYGAAKEDLDALQIGVQELLLTELAANSNLRIVERSRIRQIIDEQNLGDAGRVDAQTAARIGKVVGARYVVTGVFIDLNGDFRMDGRVIDVETSEILKTEQVRDRRANLYDMLVELATKITAGVNLPPLPSAERESRKEREIPPEAITLFSRAQVYADGGHKDRAIELSERIAKQFPQMVQASEALKQIRGEG
jgi:TolB-like protein